MDQVSSRLFPRLHKITRRPLLARRTFLYFLTVEMLLIGAWLQASFDDAWFARMGAMITVLALLALYQTLSLSNQASQFSEGLAILHKLKKSRSKVVTDEPAGETHEFDLLNYGVIEMIKLFDDVEKAKKKDSISLSFVQIEIAVIGTVVWAFGDLVPL